MKKDVLTTVAALSLGLLAAWPAAAQQSQTPRQPQQNTSQSSQPGAGANSSPNQTAGVDLNRDQIRRVQQALDQKGFKAGRSDGRMGPETRDAVRSFQQKQGMQANGEIDQQTLAALNLRNLSQSGTQPSTVGRGRNQNPTLPPGHPLRQNNNNPGQ
jgi:peptidoglycan hydrolase-like protein with peptidoglycan-binding domain